MKSVEDDAYLVSQTPWLLSGSSKLNDNTAHPCLSTPEVTGPCPIDDPVEREDLEFTAPVEATAHRSACQPIQASSAPLCASLQTHSVDFANEEVVIQDSSTLKGSPNEDMLP